MINAPNTIVRTGDRIATAFGIQGERRPTASFSTSGTSVMNTAPRMPPRIVPIPPTITAARKKIEYTKGKLSGVTTRKK